MVTTRHETELSRRDRMHMPRSRGAASGLLIVLLGVWGGLVPFVGPSFGYSFTPDVSWDWTTGRLLLEVLPAAATVLGGLSMMGTASRVSGWFGGWLAAAGGAWFVIGQWVSILWNNGVMQAGQPTATSDAGKVAEWLGFFLGLGVVIVFLAALAMGRMSVVSLRDARWANERAAARDEEAMAEAHQRRTADEHAATDSGTRARGRWTGRRVRDERTAD